MALNLLRHRATVIKMNPVFIIFIIFAGVFVNFQLTTATGDPILIGMLAIVHCSDSMESEKSLMIVLCIMQL